MNIITTPGAHRLGRADRPFDHDRRHNADFARAAVFEEFGRHAWAIDQDDFTDRLPWESPKPSPEVRSAL